MSAEVEVTIDTEVGEVKKTRLGNSAVLRFAREAFILGLLADSQHAPTLLRKDSEEHSFTTEYVEGRTFAEIFSVDTSWNGVAKDWSEAGPLLAQYIEAEQAILDKGLLYRDLRPEHLIFTGDHAVLVDYEETLVGGRASTREWYPNDRRHGAWAMMAPEEFRGHGILTPKTVTYRAATIAHVALAGRLPVLHPVADCRKRLAPSIARTLPWATRRVFRDALDVHLDRRHGSPTAFFEELTTTYEDTV